MSEGPIALLGQGYVRRGDGDKRSSWQVECEGGRLYVAKGGNVWRCLALPGEGTVTGDSIPYPRRWLNDFSKTTHRLNKVVQGAIDS